MLSWLASSVKLSADPLFVAVFCSLMRSLKKALACSSPALLYDLGKSTAAALNMFTWPANWGQRKVKTPTLVQRTHTNGDHWDNYYIVYNYKIQYAFRGRKCKLHYDKKTQQKTTIINTMGNWYNIFGWHLNQHKLPETSTRWQGVEDRCK